MRNICFVRYRLIPAEIVLNEYCMALKHVLKALNILQSDTNTHMVWLLPVIFQLQGIQTNESFFQNVATIHQSHSGWCQKAL